MKERYPLEAARTLRADEEEARTRELADATRAHELACAAVERAEAMLRAHREHTARVAEDELARDRAGRTIAETLRAQDWLSRRSTEAKEHERSVAREREKERSAGAAVEEARARLAAARAEREAVEKHFAKWSAERARIAEKKEEEDVEGRRR